VNVLLLHAFPLDERMWEPQLGALSDHEVHAPTLYPLGSSMDEWADALLAQVDGPLLVCGASMGGYCALALVRRAPERIAALMLEGARIDADSPERHAGRAKTLELIRSGGVEALWEDMRPKLFSDRVSPATVERTHEIALEQDPAAVAVGVQAIRDRPDSTEAVAAFNAPILVAQGGQDPFLSVEEARTYPARLEVFENTGHLPSLEQPDRFNRLLLELIAEV
jgi:pimeloyl-ACP methyl ester carboxylesterase